MYTLRSGKDWSGLGSRGVGQNGWGGVEWNGVQWNVVWWCGDVECNEFGEKWGGLSTLIKIL